MCGVDHAPASSWNGLVVLRSWEQLRDVDRRGREDNRGAMSGNKNDAIENAVQMPHLTGTYIAGTLTYDLASSLFTPRQATLKPTPPSQQQRL